VPDRGTLLMGGQRLMADVEIESGVPVLSRIPYLNRFFTNRSHVKDERSLLILIKPTILIQGELEEDHFPGMMQDPGSFTIGRAY
jgi:general secretion pathway protein D